MGGVLSAGTGTTAGERFMTFVSPANDAIVACRTID
jgi:hypothetical protein